MLSSILTLTAALSTASALSTGFNYGSTNSDGSNRMQSDFETQFQTAQKLVGTNGEFASARLYTMIQAGTPNTPISGIPAAIKTNTTLLLGIWASAGPDIVNNEIAALKSAISTYGTQFTNLVVGLSVGSEDLYRDSIVGQQAKAGLGVGPEIVAGYISQVRSAISETSLKNVPIGHVDTWTAWVNGTNTPVINACDWIGVDAYPYFQNTQTNAIADAEGLFFQAIDNTKGAIGAKEVWVTETGWPVSGKTENLAVPSVANAEAYWKAVGCKIFGTYNSWWYTLDDYSSSMTVPSFGLVQSETSTNPLYNLTCSAADAAAAPSSAVSSSASATATSDSAANTSSSSAASPSSTSGSSSSSGGTSTTNSTTGTGGSAGAGSESSSGPSAVVSPAQNGAGILTGSIAMTGVVAAIMAVLSL